MAEDADGASFEFQLLQAGSSYAQPTQSVPDRVSLEDPGLQVMTDLKEVTAVIVTVRLGTAFWETVSTYVAPSGVVRLIDPPW